MIEARQMGQCVNGATNHDAGLLTRSNVLSNGFSCSESSPEVVHRWAEQVINDEPEPLPAFIEIASMPLADLSGLRHALWPLVVEPDPPAVLEAILGILAADLTLGHRTLGDTVTILRQMRSMVRMPPGLYAGLNAALVVQAGANTEGPAIAGWLRQFAGSTGAPPP